MARRRLLTAAQWATYLMPPEDERQLVRHYTLGRDDLDIVAGRRTSYNRLGCALLLCYLRYPGRALEPDEKPSPRLLAFVARQIGAEPGDFADYQRRDQTRREQLAAITARTGHRAFDRGAFRDLTAWLLSLAQVDRDPFALAQALVDEIRRQRLLLPSAAVLELILHHARGRAERLVHRVLTDAVGIEGGQRLAPLLQGHDGEPIAMLAWLRQAPQSPVARNIVAILDRLSVLKALGVDRRLRERIPEAAFERLAAEGARMTAQHLRELSTGRRQAVLAATAIRMEADLTDAALAMFDKLMGTLARRAEHRTAEKTLTSVRDTQVKLRTLVRACRTLIAARSAGADPFDAVEQAVGWIQFERCVTDAEALAQPETTDLRTEFLERYPTIRSFSPELLGAFEFRGGQPVAALLRAIELLRTMHQVGKRSLPDRPSTGFIRRSWRRFVMPNGSIGRKAYEICAMSELRDRLRAGDIWVEGSRQFRDFESSLVPPATFDALRAEGALPVAVDLDGPTCLATRRAVLVERLAAVGGLAAQGKLEDVDMASGEPRVSPIRDQTPIEAEALGRAAYDALPRVKITDLLLEVDAWTGFTDCFTHQRSGRPADDRAAMLTAVLADGINLGLTRMADACRGVTMRQLAWVHDWHVREETYAAALARITDLHRTLPLATAWGDGTTSSSDGQFYRAGGRGEASGDVNARHGNEPGVAFYTHVSDQYGPFHTKLIAATASEAPYVIDGVLYHKTGLSIEEHYTDTGGVTDHAFGLCQLSGFRFAPRIRDLKDRRLYQVYRASGLILLVSAVILWNTRYLQAAVSELRDRGTDVRPEFVRHVAPLGWEHIGLTGDYVWDAEPLPTEGLRPLRRAVSTLAA